jgi:hypothetical protein
MFEEELDTPVYDLHFVSSCIIIYIRHTILYFNQLLRNQILVLCWVSMIVFSLGLRLDTEHSTNHSDLSRHPHSQETSC